MRLEHQCAQQCLCPALPLRPQGKDKPTFCSNKDDGDVVVVVNAAEAELTGRKWDQKLYRWHTGYPGGLKERTAKEMAEKKPDYVLRQAVLGMLPKNNLRRVRSHPSPATLRTWPPALMGMCRARLAHHTAFSHHGPLSPHPPSPHPPCLPPSVPCAVHGPQAAHICWREARL